MASQISDEIIENICILAKLDLSDDEKIRAGYDMQKILAYIDKLNELNTDGVEPLTHVFPVHNVFREDIIADSSPKEDMLANAPQKKEDMYMVPKTINIEELL